MDKPSELYPNPTIGYGSLKKKYALVPVIAYQLTCMKCREGVTTFVGIVALPQMDKEIAEALLLHKCPETSQTENNMKGSSQ